MSKNTKILLKRSTVAGKAPTADIMESGEAFVNLAKGTEHLYFKNAENEVIATKLGTLDKELDETSENGVENQAITKKYDELKKQLDSIALTYSVYGFARVNGDNSPDGTIFFGKDSNLEEITSHVHMGLTTKEGKLYKKCANCRLDLADDGTELKIDGTDGDVMLFTDSKLYFLKGTVAAPADLNLGDGVELNIIAFGISPFSIYGVNAKAFAPFAFNPQYTVNCQIPGVDNVVCAHSIYNTAYAGSYIGPADWFNETFKSNGNGYPSCSISSMDSIWYAQGKNADQKTNRPYMGGYYEFYEIFIALMFCELKSVYHQDIKSFGTGCTNFDPNLHGTDAYIAKSADSYVTIGNETSANYLNQIGISFLSSKYELINDYYSTGDFISGISVEYNVTEMLEPIRVLNDIAKAGLISKIWDGVTQDSANKHVAFEYDYDGNMKVSDFTNEELTTGANMIPNHKYYQVRSVPNTKGMADGAMTAVVNIFVKMTFRDGLKLKNLSTNETYSLDGGYAIYKFSHPVYRGMCLLDGKFSLLQGCHYVGYCIEGATGEDGFKLDEYVNYFKCAENVDDIPAQQAKSIEYSGDVNKELEMERGLTKVVQIGNDVITNMWMKKADYNASLLCYIPHEEGSISTCECAYLDYTGYSSVGNKEVNALAVGCTVNKDYPSVRSINNYSANIDSDSFTGRFSIPHLSLINDEISGDDSL